MKKRSFSIGALALILLSIALFLSSCEMPDALVQYINPIKDHSAPYFRYDPETDTTEVSISLLFDDTLSDAPEYKIKSFSFYIEFYDPSGKLIDERLCHINDPQDDPQGFVRFYQFGGAYGGAVLPAIEGCAASVRYRAAGNPVIYENETYNADGSMKWRTVDTLVTVLALLPMAAALVISIVWDPTAPAHMASITILSVVSLAFLMIYHFWLRIYIAF